MSPRRIRESGVPLPSRGAPPLRWSCAAAHSCHRTLEGCRTAGAQLGHLAPESNQIESSAGPLSFEYAINDAGCTY